MSEAAWIESVEDQLHRAHLELRLAQQKHAKEVEQLHTDIRRLKSLLTCYEQGKLDIEYDLTTMMHASCFRFSERLAVEQPDADILAKSIADRLSAYMRQLRERSERCPGSSDQKLIG